MSSKSRSVASYLAITIVVLGIVAQVVRIAQVQSATGDIPMEDRL